MKSRVVESRAEGRTNGRGEKCQNLLVNLSVIVLADQGVSEGNIGDDTFDKLEELAVVLGGNAVLLAKVVHLLRRHGASPWVRVFVAITTY